MATITPDQLAKALGVAAKDIEKPRDLLQAIARLVETNAKARAHVRTGNLRDSITNRVEGNVAYVGTAVDYALWQPNDFLQEGLDDSMSQIDGETRDYGEKVLDRVARG